MEMRVIKILLISDVTARFGRADAPHNDKR
jgi:hypothetical protein